jgi:hypothetical protein
MLSRKKKIGSRHKNIEACENNREKLSMRGYGNHPIILIVRESSIPFSAAAKKTKMTGHKCHQCGYKYFFASLSNINKFASGKCLKCPDCDNIIPSELDKEILINFRGGYTSPPTWKH